MNEQEKNNIINEYINYCNDLQLNANKKTSKKKFINAYMRQFITWAGLTHAAQEQEKIEKIIYNTKILTSKIK